CITTPNMNSIPQFPFFDHRGPFIREDGNWGPHEFTRWPQLRSGKAFVHHSCIPRRPVDPQDPFYDSIVWRRFSLADWTPDPRFLEAGVGQLQESLINQLSIESEALLRQLNACIESHKIHNPKHITEKDETHVKLMGIALRDGISRLRNLADTPRAVIFAAATLQRMLLEDHGWLNWVVDIRYRSENIASETFQTLHVRGSFVHNGDNVIPLYHIGVPVWFIRPI
ncbi:hypothetical protein BD410DRAFT_705894, partial [Rickenella mellea]